jgi:hypothetical protein
LQKELTSANRKQNLEQFKKRFAPSETRLLESPKGRATGSPISLPKESLSTISEREIARNVKPPISPDAKLLDQLTARQKEAFSKGTPQEQQRALDHLRLKYKLEKNLASRMGEDVF